MDKAALWRLYLDEKLSARQIADRLGESEAKVVYWLDKYNIPKRSISEAIYNRINGETEPFRPKTGLTAEEEKLKAAGLTLWVTEGSLKTKHRVFSSNSNPSLISVFQNFLLRIAGVRKDKIQLRVLYYPNMDLTEKQVLMFWMRRTGLARNQIKIDRYTAVHNFRAKSRYGTATVYVDNIKLRQQMEEWLEALYREIGE